MADYYVSIGDREYHVKITGSGIAVNDETIHCELFSLNASGLYQLNRTNQSIEVHLSALPRRIFEAIIGERRILARVDAHRRRRSSAPQSDAGKITAPMPGLIVDIRASDGEKVEQGQVLVVQEAMKMQMRLRAPFAGVVRRVVTEVGSQVEKNALLVEMLIDSLPEGGPDSRLLAASTGA
jgi:biotin carboxyl carrier protein